ncbi:MAG: htrA 1, partial [Brevibacillus sp.]|nr:htrA 1 [Brevibacillus sp.]
MLLVGSFGNAEIFVSTSTCGSPLGLENSVTAGIISAKNRRLQVAKRLYEEIFQTDATIN